MLKCAVIGLAVLCCVSGFELFSTLNSLTTKRDAPSDATTNPCIIKSLSDGTVSSQCTQALTTAADEPATIAAVCSQLCDSLYTAAVRCVGKEATIKEYSQTCTNGYKGPS